MPIRHGGIEFLPRSVPIVAMGAIDLLDIAVLRLTRPIPAFLAGEAGARPDHSISGSVVIRGSDCIAILISVHRRIIRRSFSRTPEPLALRYPRRDPPSEIAVMYEL